MSGKRSLLSILAFVMTASAVAQAAPFEQITPYPQPKLSAAPWFALQSIPGEFTETAQPAEATRLLRDFRDDHIKFSLSQLMATLRDHQHEGWVLAAYPDPNTRRPLIGAGFSLDVPARVHPQTDLLNPHPFLEPSSAALWQAAGLPADRLQQILDQYDRNLNSWTPRTYHRKVIRQKLTPQLSEEEGEQLLRISAIQAIYNAKAYCRSFDQLSASQQMALSQLVFQMGVNLEQFVSFLSALNDPDGARELAQLDGYLETEREHWRTVQDALIDSQWAHRYSGRAASVIAMFDPEYSQAPGVAEQRVVAVLRPPAVVRRQNLPKASLRLASYTKRTAKGHRRKTSRIQVKRRLT